jgi:fatty acid-binding protein DegV
VVLKEKVRTASRALARLTDLAEEAANDSDVDIAVQHLGAEERAKVLHEALVGRLGKHVREAYLTEVGAVVAAHTGPGVIGVALHLRP